MQLKILGCGTIIQTDSNYNCSGYLIDGALLFDCGPGIWRALHKFKQAPAHIDHIFLSHFHVDHCSDLAPILQERSLDAGQALKEMWIYGPRGLKEWYERFTSFLGKWAVQMPVRLSECGIGNFQAGSYRVSALPTGHTENSLCYRLEKEDTHFFYSGDTDENENVVSMAKGCHLALMEASCPEKDRQPGHLTPSLAAKIASRAGVKNLCLTHMYPPVRSGHPEKQASRHFNGKIYLAEDGLQIVF